MWKLRQAESKTKYSNMSKRSTTELPGKIMSSIYVSTSILPIFPFETAWPYEFKKKMEIRAQVIGFKMTHWMSPRNDSVLRTQKHSAGTALWITQTHMQGQRVQLQDNKILPTCKSSFQTLCFLLSSLH